MPSAGTPTDCATIRTIGSDPGHACRADARQNRHQYHANLVAGAQIESIHLREKHGDAFEQRRPF